MLLVFCSIFILNPTVTNAASKNVTKKYRKNALAVISQFDEYLGYGCNELYSDNGKEKRSSFAFNDYARSTMLCLKNRNYIGKTPEQLKKLYKNEWLKYFTASFDFKLKKNQGMNGYYPVPNQWSNVSYLIQISKSTGQAQYWGGDWGTRYPKGYVKKIIQKHSKFVVSYNIYWWDSIERKKDGLMGSYTITLKKHGSSFRISGIKRIKAQANV